MDIQSKKLDLIQWLIHLSDENILNKVEALQTETSDFWNELTDEQKLEISKGLGELDKGQKNDYEQVISKHR